MHENTMEISLYISETIESESHSVVSDCDPMNYTVHGILQARILEWVAISFSKSSFPTQESSPGLLSLYFHAPKHLAAPSGKELICLFNTYPLGVYCVPGC